MCWSVSDANTIIALRCAVQSNRFDDFRERRAGKIEMDAKICRAPGDDILTFQWNTCPESSLAEFAYLILIQRFTSDDSLLFRVKYRLVFKHLFNRTPCSHTAIITTSFVWLKV